MSNLVTVQQDSGQEIVKIMRHSSDQAANDRHVLGFLTVNGDVMADRGEDKTTPGGGKFRRIPARSS